MTNPYRHVDSNGKVTYSDLLPSASEPTRAKSDEEARREHQEAVKYIKEAQKRIPKLQDYWEYIEFLRSHSPSRHRLMLEALQREDPAAYLKLQKYPAFRPLRDTALGWKAADKHLAAGIGFATGKFTGSVEKWLETTVKDMMKAQGWGPYDVLRKPTKPFNAKPPTYSNTRFGQHLKGEDARLVKSAEVSAKALDSSRAAKKFAGVTAVTRVLGPAIDLGLHMSNPQRFSDLAAFKYNRKIESLHGKGIISPEQAIVAQNLLSEGKGAELGQYLKDLQAAYIRGEQ